MDNLRKKVAVECRVLLLAFIIDHSFYLAQFQDTFPDIIILVSVLLFHCWLQSSYIFHDSLFPLQV